MTLERVMVTGGAGFIGSNVVDALVARGVRVLAYDNLSTGRAEFLAGALSAGAELVEGDLLDLDLLTKAMAGCDAVIHLAANADVRFGLDHPRRDLEQNTIATWNVLEAVRLQGVSRMAFSSTGSVYGEPEVFPTPETAPFPVQTSLYAASKLAGEGMISAYATGYGFTALIYRFVSILGERYTHGHVFDFYNSLRRDPTSLCVLGDGRQEKSYLHVGDCVRGILTGLEHHEGQVGAFVYNLGTDETIIVDNSVSHICAELGVSPTIEKTGGKRGWTGDSPLIHLDCSKMRALGWQPELTIRQGISRTLGWLADNPSVLEKGSV